MSNLNKCSKLINIYFGVDALYLKTTYLLFHWWWVLQRIILKVEKVIWNMLTSQLCRSKRQCYSHFHFRKYQPGLSSCKGAVRKAKEVKCFQEKCIERAKMQRGQTNPFLHFFSCWSIFVNTKREKIILYHDHDAAEDLSFLVKCFPISTHHKYKHKKENMLAFKYVSERFNFWTRPKIKGPHSVVVKVNMVSYLRLVLFKTLIREVLERFFLIAFLFFQKQYWNWNTNHSTNPWKIVKNYWRRMS